MRQRRADYRCFLIGRNEHCGMSRQLLCPVPDRQSRSPGLPGQPQPCPAEVHREFIGKAQAEPEGGKGEQFMLHQHQHFDQGMPASRHLRSPFKESTTYVE